MKSIQSKDFIEAGTVVKAHGTKGEVRIATQFPVKYTEWAFLEIREKPVPFYIEQAQPVGNNEYLLKLTDINSLEKAQQLSGYVVLVPKQKGKKRQQEETWNLTGFMIAEKNAGNLGKVIRVEQLPQQTMLVVDYKNGELLIPLVEDFIDDINEEKEIITLRLPEGFLEMND